MRVLLVNRTRYVDAEILGVLAPITALIERQKGPRKNRKSVVVFFQASKSRRDGDPHRIPSKYGERAGYGYSGRAWVLGDRAVLNVPGDGLDAASLAALWYHELWHLWGVRGHRDFPAAVNACALRTIESAMPTSPPAMLVPRPAEPVLPAPRMTDEEKATRRAERRASAVARLEERRAEWQRKKARAERALAKIARSLAGYERRTAAAARRAR